MEITTIAATTIVIPEEKTMEVIAVERISMALSINLIRSILLIQLCGVFSLAAVNQGDGSEVYQLHNGHVLTIFPQDERPSHQQETPWVTGGDVVPDMNHYAIIESSFDYNPLKIPPQEELQPAPTVIEEPSFLPEEIQEPEQLSEATPPIQGKTPYRLRPGDKVNISIYGEKDSTRLVTIDPQGYIYYLYVQPIKAQGRTINELRLELNEKLKVQFNHALAAVTAVSVGTSTYTILGEVNEPGQKELEGKATLLSALGSARGVTRGPFRNQITDFGDLNKAFLARNGEYVPIDFKRLIRDGDGSQDVLLEHGDYIYIPTGIVQNIYILGEVNYPTTLSYLETVSLVEALAQAQWITNAASSRILVLRGSLSCPTKYLIDINSIMRRCEPDFILEPGDIVYVPPMRFLHLRLIFQAAMRTFVSTCASFAGSQAMISINPSCACDAFTPVNVIGGNFNTSAGLGSGRLGY
jgi:protein involved in polysaccharide export with SLBB domain